MIQLQELCNKINMPEEVTERVLSLTEQLDFALLDQPIGKLMSRSTWDSGLEELKKLIGEDSDGMKMLTCSLVAGQATYEQYTDMGISDTIFFDTFGCFSRFVKEHKVSYGYYGFDRYWWSVRQLALEEFRIGELEYEFDQRDNMDIIAIHIPSDADMSKDKLQQSYEEAVAFFAKYYPDFQYQYFTCDSWLLSPGLKDLLDESSRIIQFQNAFQIISTRPQEKDYMNWVYKNRKLTSLDEVPQETSLQRKMKAYLQQGGMIGCAYGYLKENGFL